jgi:nicotinamidase-related amidase
VVLVGQHTNCCVRHRGNDASLCGIDLEVVSDATCVCEPIFGEDTDTNAERRALGYLRTFYRANVMTSDQVF